MILILLQTHEFCSRPTCITHRTAFENWEVGMDVSTPGPKGIYILLLIDSQWQQFPHLASQAGWCILNRDAQHEVSKLWADPSRLQSRWHTSVQRLSLRAIGPTTRQTHWVAQLYLIEWYLIVGFGSHSSQYTKNRLFI